MFNSRSNWLRNTVYLIVFSFAIFLLEILLKKWEVPSYLVPLPSQVALVYVSDWRLILEDFWVTAGEWFAGMGLSILIGFLVAVVSFHIYLAQKILNPLLIVSQSVPYLIFAPLLMIWLGLGMGPKVVLVILTCTFPIALVLQNDLAHAKKEYELIVGMLKLGPVKSFFHVYLPYASPGFFNALKISASYSFVAAVLAELIGSEAGLGVYILRSQSTYRTDKVMACVLLVVFVSILFSKCIDVLKNRIVFWHKAKR